MLPQDCSTSNIIILKSCEIFPSLVVHSIQEITIRKKIYIFSKAICTCEKRYLVNIEILP